MYVLNRDELNQLLNKWTEDLEVYSPQVEDGQTMLLPYEENGFTMDYINFPFPVKEYLFKQKEILFSWENKGGNFSVQTPENRIMKERLYFGIRPCDIYGIRYMDKFFIEGYRDGFYEKNRNSAVIAAVNCLEPGKNCFCSSMGTGPFAKAGYDLLFTPVEGGYIVESGSARGEELIAASRDLFTEKNEDLQSQKNPIEESVREKFITKITATDVNRVLSDNYSHPVWQQLAKDCVSCTGCTSMCPTCTCFNVVEESTGENSGQRIRYWDSCQSDSFTRNAGEHNPRTKEARVRYRIYDKFKYIEDKFSFKGCTGCGRCINVCPASINPVNVINKLAEVNGGE